MDYNVLSVNRLLKLFLKDITPFVPDEKTVLDKQFSLYVKDKKEYVEPNLIIQDCNVELKTEIPKILLISAAGATGKSQLVEYLSHEKNMPIVNLTHIDAVGDNTLTGQLVGKLQPDGFTSFYNGLLDGTKGLLIDALDEANLRVNSNGFFSFLDDLTKWAKNSCSLVVFGRTEVMGFTMEYLKEKKISVAHYQIAPFTKEQAKMFIDKRVGKYNQPQEPTYVKLRDHIIESVESFFDKESDLSKKQSELFLGYAPVLLAISELLRKRSNYQKLLDDMQKFNKTRTQLIVTIIEYILNREKEEKINKVLLPSIIKSYDKKTQEEAIVNCYNIEEQCYRLFCIVTNQKPHCNPTNNEAFNDLYSRKLTEGEWVNEHPFLVSGCHIQNIVFESYVLLYLASCEKYEDMVMDYISSHNNNSYMLFFLYEAMHQCGQYLNPSLIPFLYDSLKTIDKKDFVSSLYIHPSHNESGCDDATIIFTVGSEDQPSSYDALFTTHWGKDFTLYPRNCFSNVEVDAPIVIDFRSEKTQLHSSIDLSCNKFIVSTPSLTFQCFEHEDYTSINCKEIVIDYQKAPQFELKTLGFSQNNFTISSTTEIPHPFSRYRIANDGMLKIESICLPYYKKLRSMMSMFRKHKRNVMGKIKDKIDNRIATTQEGERLVSSLLADGILKTSNHQYVIDATLLDKRLGVTYDSLRSFNYNEKTCLYLKGIAETDSKK